MAIASFAAGFGGLAACVSLLVALAASLSSKPSTVPLIDLSKNVSKRELLQAATSLGVFRVAGHRVDIEAALGASRAFFALPEALKHTARSESGAVGGFQRGYIPLAGEAGLRDFVELKEGLCYGAEPEDGLAAAAAATSNELQANSSSATGLSLLLSPNAWPDGHEQALGPEWAPTMLRHLDACESLTSRLLSTLSTAMGHEAAFLGELATGGEPISLMRLFHYFPNSTAPEVAPGMPRTGSSPHTDWHLLTIVVQDTTGGLQVRRPGDASWVDVPAEPKELIIILGDYLAAISKGEFVSPVHRVNLPSAPTERFSFTYFRYPRYDAHVPADAAKRAQARALRSARRRRRQMGVASAEAFNTLVRATDGVGLERLATTAFGDLLLDKWRGVAANKAS